MENSELKTRMLDLFGTVRVELDQMIDGLTDEEKNAKGSMAHWSEKDMLAHLAFWGSHLNAQIRKGQAGEAVPMAGDYYEILNDGLLLRNQDKPFEAVRAEEQAAYEETMRILEGIGADDLTDPKFLEFLNNSPLIDRALGAKCWHVLTHICNHYVKKGDLRKAEDLQISYFEKLQDFAGWKANAAYNLACFFSLNGMKEKAYKKLEIAFQERPELKEWALKDSDLKPICEEVEFKALVN